MSSLFRKQAMDVKRNAAMADVAFWPQISALGMTTTGSVVVAAIACLLTLRVPIGLRVTGETTYDSETVAVRAPVNGVVVSLSVEAGETLTAGSTFCIIAEDRTTGELLEEQSFELQELQSQVAAANAAAVARDSEAAAVIRAAAAKTEGVRAKLAKVDTQIDRVSQLVRSESYDLERLRKLLSNQLITRERFEQQQRYSTELETKLTDLRADRVILIREQAEIDAETNLRVEQLRSESQAKRLEAQTVGLIEEKRRASFDIQIRTPVAGTVIARPVAEGDYVPAGRLLAIVKRKDSTPRVTMFFRDTEVRNIKAGMPFAVRLESSAQRRAVWEAGHIESVGLAALSRDDIGRFQLPTNEMFVPVVGVIDAPADKDFWSDHFVVRVPLQARVGARPKLLGTLIIEKLFPAIGTHPPRAAASGE